MRRSWNGLVGGVNIGAQAGARNAGSALDIENLPMGHAARIHPLLHGLRRDADSASQCRLTASSKHRIGDSRIHYSVFVH